MQNQGPWVFYLALPFHKAKWVQLNGKTLQVLKSPLYSADLPNQPKHLEYFGKRFFTISSGMNKCFFNIPDELLLMEGYKRSTSEPSIFYSGSNSVTMKTSLYTPVSGCLLDQLNNDPQYHETGKKKMKKIEGITMTLTAVLFLRCIIGGWGS